VFGIHNDLVLKFFWGQKNRESVVIVMVVRMLCNAVSLLDWVGGLLWWEREPVTWHHQEPVKAAMFFIINFSDEGGRFECLALWPGESWLSRFSKLKRIQKRLPIVWWDIFGPKGDDHVHIGFLRDDSSLALKRPNSEFLRQAFIEKTGAKTSAFRPGRSAVLRSGFEMIWWRICSHTLQPHQPRERQLCLRR
jgi:hypothetical protein